jgi:hypothetical protein
MAASNLECRDLSQDVRARRSIRQWSGFVLYIAVLTIPFCLILIAILVTRRQREAQWLLLSILLVLGAVAALPVALAARRGVKWGVGAVAAVVVTGLVAVPLFLAVVALRGWFQDRSVEEIIAVLGLACFPSWIAWRHARAAFFYLTVGDRSLLFSESPGSVPNPRAGFRPLPRIILCLQLSM